MKKLILILGLTALTHLSLSAQKTGHTQDSLKTIELEEVSVLATRPTKQTPMSYTQIGKKHIQKSNLGQDLPYLLQLQPSVVANSDAGAGIGYTGMRIRGVDTQGINVVINGVPLNDSESQGVFWVNMADFASSVQELQLQRGVGSSTNGAGAFGASLNMRTDNLSIKPYSELTLGYGSYSTNKQSYRFGTGRLKGRWILDGRISRVKSDGYIDRASFNGLGYFVQGAYLGDKMIIKLLSFGGKEKTGIAWWGLRPEHEQFGRTFNNEGVIELGNSGNKTTALAYQNTDNYRQHHNQLICSYKFNRSLSLNFTAHYTRGFGYTDEYKKGWYGDGVKLKEYGLNPFEKKVLTKDQDGKIFEETQTVKKTKIIRRKYLDNHFYGGIATLDWKKDKLHLDLGLSANGYIGQHYGEIRWIKEYPKAVDPENRYYDDTANKYDASGFVKANYEIIKGLSTYVDLQYRFIKYTILGTYDGYDQKRQAMQEIDLNKNFHFFNPKLGLFYQINPNQNVYASVSVAHREPNRKTFTDLEESSYPRAERLIDNEVGYAYKNRVFSGKANFYFMKYKDQLVLNGKMSNVGGYLVENVADSYRMGLELSASYRPLDWLRLDANLALSRNKIKEYKYYIEDWDNGGFQEFQAKDTNIAYTPNIISSGALTLSKWGLETSLSAFYVGKQHLDNTGSQGRVMPAYFYSNLLIDYKIPFSLFKDCHLSFQLNNLFNSLYFNNAWAYGYIYKGKEHNDIATYPQAPRNFLLGLRIAF